MWTECSTAGTGWPGGDSFRALGPLRFKRQVRSHDARRGRDQFRWRFGPYQSDIRSASLIEAVRIPERWIELADRFTNGAVEHHPIAKFRQVDIGREPIGDLADAEVWLVIRA